VISHRAASMPSADVPEMSPTMYMDRPLKELVSKRLLRKLYLMAGDKGENDP
jgi:hypothetical protein